MSPASLLADSEKFGVVAYRDSIANDLQHRDIRNVITVGIALIRSGLLVSKEVPDRYGFSVTYSLRSTDLPGEATSFIDYQLRAKNLELLFL